MGPITIGTFGIPVTTTVLIMMRTTMLLRLGFLMCIVCLIKGPAMAAPPPANIAKTVTFVFLADDKGEPRIQNDAPIANGTGFFVVV
jgi:hypothetical protein